MRGVSALIISLLHLAILISAAWAASSEIISLNQRCSSHQIWKSENHHRQSSSKPGRRGVVEDVEEEVADWVGRVWGGACRWNSDCQDLNILWWLLKTWWYAGGFQIVKVVIMMTFIVVEEGRTVLNLCLCATRTTTKLVSDINHLPRSGYWTD